MRYRPLILPFLGFSLAFAVFVSLLPSFASAEHEDRAEKDNALLAGLGITAPPAIPLDTVAGESGKAFHETAPDLKPERIVASDLMPERIVWNKIPIRLTLPVGRERLVHFPTPVRVGVPTALESRLRTQSVDNTVYWLAHESFDAQRVQVREIATGLTYLFDLQAREAAPARPVEVVRSETTATDSPSVPLIPVAETTQHPNLDYVQLTRFAAQQLYAPPRLHRDLPGVFQTPLSTIEVSLVRGARVEALPLIAWRGGDLFVTVVRLRNLTTKPVILDPRDLRGEWQAATFQHARLLPADDEADTTCVYLISTRPFEEALGSRLSWR